LKIYFFVDRMKVGGVKTIIYSLISYLARKHYDCVLVVNESPIGFHVDKCDVVKVGFGLTRGSKLLTLLSAIFPAGIVALVSMSKRKDNAVIHLNSPYPTIAIAAIASSLLTRTPLVYTIHANKSHIPTWAWFTERIIFKFARVIIAELMVSVSDVKKLNLDSKLHYIPFGVSLLSTARVWNPTISHQYEFIAVCRLDPNRYVDVFIMSISKLVQSGAQQVRLKIIGDGVEKERLNELVFKLGLVGNIEFCVSVPERQIQNELVGSSCFLTISAAGEVGMAGKIAAGICMPCIAYDISGFNSFYCADTIDGFVSLMKEMIGLNHEEKKEYGKEINRLLYSSDDQMVTAYEQVYREMMK